MAARIAMGLMVVFLHVSVGLAEECGGPRTALRFDGVDDSAWFGDFGTLLGGVSEITVEFWQKVNTVKVQSTFSMSAYVNGSVFNAHVPYSDGKVYWDFGNISTGGRLSYLPPSGWVGTWQHFALVASQSGDYMRIYRNGNLDPGASKAGMTPFIGRSLNLHLGGTPSLGISFDGDIDEFRIWSVARTQAEIQADMNRSLSVPQPGLWVYYRLDEGAGSTYATDAASGFPLNLINGTTWTGSGARFRPCATTSLPTKVGNSVRLSGLANPNGLATAVRMEWGILPNFFNSTVPFDVGSGTAFVPIPSYDVSCANLVPDTLYHARARADNAGGIAYGEQVAFFCATGPRTVTAAADSGPGTLREIIDSCIGGETILFAPNLPDTITLTSGELVIRNDVTIIGPGATNLAIVASSHRVFHIANGVAVISGLRLTGRVQGQDGADGTAISPGGMAGGDAGGGGILVDNNGTLSLVECVMVDCVAQGGRGGNGYSGLYFAGEGGIGGKSCGGAIRNAGTATLERCALMNNHSRGGDGGNGGRDPSPFPTGKSGNGGAGGVGRGGALCTPDYSEGSGNPFAVRNSTLTGNDATGGHGGRGGDQSSLGFSSGDGGAGGAAKGGAIYISIGCSDVSGCEGLVQSTISDNQAISGPGGTQGQNLLDGPVGDPGVRGQALGGGVHKASFGDFLVLNSTIIAGNHVGVAGGEAPDIWSAPIFSWGHNLIGIADGIGGWSPTDLLGLSSKPLDPMLDPLRENGGPTPTMALQPCSPAVNAGALMPPLATDQRGLPRPDGAAAADIGAYEVQASVPACFGLTVNSSCGGTVLRAPDQPRFPSSSLVTLQAIPATGWSFSHWSGDASGFNNPLQVIVTSDTSVTANFQPLASACACSAEGMVAWWPAGLNANDVIGANHGTLQGGATFSPGQVGSAFSLDGVNGYVLVADSPAVSIIGAMTIEGWIRPTQFDPSVNNTILSKFEPAANQVSFNFAVAQGALGFTVFQNAAVYREVAGTTAAVPLNAWTHVAATFDPVSQAMKLHANGVELPATVNGPAVPQIMDSTAPLRLGVLVDGFGQFIRHFAGQLDEMSLYNRALSASEIQAIYHAGAAGKCLSPFYITEVSRSGSSVTLTWQSLPGLTYRVQYKQAPDDPLWLDLPGDVEATAKTASKVDNTPSGANERYYRVMVLR